MIETAAVAAPRAAGNRVWSKIRPNHIFSGLVTLILVLGQWRFQILESHPLTGVRLILDSSKKSEIRYIVVNHSAADLGDLTLHVVLRAASAGNGQPPVSRFSFKLDKLGPWEAREMASSIETSAKSVNIPDWTNLKAEFQITSP